MFGITSGQTSNIKTASKEEGWKPPRIFEAEANKIIAHCRNKIEADLPVDAGLSGAYYFATKNQI